MPGISLFWEGKQGVVAGVIGPCREGSRVAHWRKSICIHALRTSKADDSRQAVRAGAVYESPSSTPTSSSSGDLPTHYERTAYSQGLVYLDDGSSHFRVWAPHAASVTLQIAPHMPAPVYPPPPTPWPRDAPGEPPPPEPRWGFHDIDVGEIMEVCAFARLLRTPSGMRTWNEH
jgi:hypothetical protein